MGFDDKAGAQVLHGRVDRLRANIATSQAAYAEASRRVDYSLTPARPSLAQALKQRRKLRVEMLVD
jgi:DNA-binding HxlR family transcriptional regulator